MADGNWDTIEGLLNTRLSEVLQGEKIIYENQGGADGYVEGEEGGIYVTQSFLPGSPLQIEVGDNGRNRNLGTYQVAINIPAGVGKAEAYQIQKIVTSGFKRGTVLDGGDVKVRCVSSHPAPGFETGTRFRVPIIVSWLADVAN